MQYQLPLYDTPTILRRAFVVVVAGLILGFVGFRVIGMRTPPILSVVSPSDELATSSRVVMIVGQTEPGATVLINGNVLAPDGTGAFSTEVVLSPGINMVTIEAKRRHSSTAKIERVIRVERNDAPLACGASINLNGCVNFQG